MLVVGVCAVMDLKEYVLIFRKNKRIFFAVLGVSLLGATLIQFFWPRSFSSHLTLNVTRGGSQETSDYAYDDFYRLQADERFSGTIVSWLGSPGIAVEICNDAGVDVAEMKSWKIRRLFKAQRLSSQAIQVRYGAPDEKTARKLSSSISKIINEKTSKLNHLQKEKQWFVVLAEDPMIEKSAPDWKLTFLFSLVAGIFIGTWAVFIKNYLD